MSEYLQSYGVLEKKVTELCESKTKHSDSMILAGSLPQTFGRERSKLNLLQKHCLVESNNPLNINDLLRDDEDLELAMVIVMEYYPKEEWELVLRNRLQRLRRTDLLALLPMHEISCGKINHERVHDDGSLTIQMQIRIQRELESENPNMHLYALEALKSRLLEKESEQELIRDIAKKHLGKLLISSQDPEVIALLLEIIVRLGVNGKNARAVVTKLENFCEAWPLKGRRCVDLFLSEIKEEEVDEDLWRRVMGLRIERVKYDFPEIEDMLPSYFVSSHDDVKKVQSDVHLIL